MCLYKFFCLSMTVIMIFTGDIVLKTDELASGTIIGEEGDQTASGLTEATYTIEMKEYEYKNIHVDYPQVKGLGDKRKEDKINRLIENHLIAGIIADNPDHEPPDESGMELECRVALQSQELFSYCYVGVGFRDDGVHRGRPTELFCFMTIDMKEAEELWLSDLVDINETLIKRLKSSTDISNRLLEQDPNNQILRESLLYTIKRADIELEIDYLEEGECGFIMEPETLTVEMPAMVCDGDYVLVRLPGKIKDNRFIFDESLDSGKVNKELPDA